MPTDDAIVVPFPGATAPSSDSWAGRDLSGQDLSDRDLKGADLTDCDLSGTILDRADLTGACLFRASLEEASFTGAILRDADLREVRGDRVGFGATDLSGADLSGAQLPRASFTHAVLQQTCLVATDLSQARLQHCDLTGADFRRSRLHHATLSQCDAGKATFRGANLRGGRIANIRHFDSADWVGADLREVDTCGAYELRRFAHDQNYLDEFYERSTRNKVVYGLWWLTSDCGRSSSRWAAWVAVLALLYAGLYSQLAVDFGPNETALSPLYFSVVTLTTLGYGDALPTDAWSQLAVMSEVVCGYAMLGGLLAILSNKMARRAD